MKTFPWREFLKQDPTFLADWGDAELDALLEDTVSSEHSVSGDTVILRQGDVGDSVFVIGSGSAEAFVKHGDGTEFRLVIMGKGEIAGEMGALENRPRSATVRTMEPSIVLEIRGKRFRKLMDDHPELKYRMLQKMSERLRNITVKLEDLDMALEQRMEQRTAELAAINTQLEASNARLQELDRLKSDFVTDLSHELRTPLTSICGFVQCLLEGMGGELSPVQRDFLTRVYGNTERLTRLINDLLDLARIEAGRVELHVAPQSLREVAEDVVEELRRLTASKAVDLDVERPSTDLLVLADRDKLHEILLNLTHNAVKFTPAGGRIRVRMEVRSDDTVMTLIQDTGKGIPPDELARVFEKFYQVGDPEAPKRGSGLGLTITRKLVDLHGGAIWVESTLGQGTTFGFALPAARPEA